LVLNKHKSVKMFVLTFIYLYININKLSKVTGMFSHLLM